MALIDVQIGMPTFLDLVRAQVLATDLPAEALDALHDAGLYLDRLTVETVELVDGAPGGSGSPDPAPGQVLVHVVGTIHATDRATLLATPALSAPAITQTATLELCLLLSVSGRQLAYVLTAARIGLPWISPTPVVTGSLDLAPAGHVYLGGRIVLSADRSFLALRFATSANDDLTSAPKDRRGGSSVAVLVSGEALAEDLGARFTAAIDKTIAASSSPKVELRGRTPAFWAREIPGVVAMAALNAEHAIIGVFDVPFTVSVAATFAPQRSPHPVRNPFFLAVDATVSWDLDGAFDLATMHGFGGLILDKLSEEISGQIGQSGLGTPIGQSDTSVTVRVTQMLDIPSSALFDVSTDDVVVGPDGLVLRLSFTPWSDLGATWSMAPSQWVTEGDCTSRSLKRVRRPAVVTIVGRHPHRPIRFLSAPASFIAWPPHGLAQADGSPSAWSEDGVSFSAPRVSPVTAEIRFALPGGVREQDSADSPVVILETSVGVRRAELTVESVGRSPSELAPDEWLRATAALISSCMAISDRWGMGILNLDWLVDPPDLDFGRPALREWAVAVGDLGSRREIRVVALGRDGTRREVGVLPVLRGGVRAEIMTGADETLELDADGPVDGPVPRVTQRWVVPVEATPGEVAGEPLFRSRSGGGVSVLVVHDGELLNAVAGPRVAANRVVLR
ncbi:MAG: hypothetical protein U0Q14_11470 [Dermatophilaceae bacterium]